MKRRRSTPDAGSLSLVLALLVGMATAASACVIIDPRPRPPRPPLPPPAPPPRVTLPIETRSHRAGIEIRDLVARVEVKAVFFNPNPFEVEGTYSFPIARGATVSSFSMKVDGKEVEAELVDADRARRIYEDIVRRRRDPALLEFVGDRMIRARVYPIRPRGEVRIELRYEELLAGEAGFLHFHYPLRSARPRRGSIREVLVSVEIASREPLKNIYCRTQDVSITRDGDRRAKVVFEASGYVPAKDFDLYALASPDDVGASVLCHREKGGKGTFLLLLSPRVELGASQAIAKRIVFVLDRSGSMAGRKMEQAREALRFCVSSLNAEDAFGIVAFGTDVDAFRDELLPASEANVRDALAFLKGVKAIGGTAIRDALVKSLELLGEGDGKALPAVVFITDGRPTIGETRIDAILAEVKKSGRRKARIFAFGVGDDVNTDLLDRLAVENRGTREYVRPDQDLEVAISRFYTKIASPVLADVKLAFRGIEASGIYPRRLPDLFRGTQLALFGRFEGEGRATVVLEGEVGGKAHRYEYTLPFEPKAENGFLPRLWAIRKVAFLLEEIRLHGRDEELVAEIRRLGKRYGIVTPYTSFLILDERELARAPALRRELRKVEEAFEREKEGEGAVDAASAVARGAAAAPGSAEQAGRALGKAVGGRLRRSFGGGGGRAGARPLIRKDAIVRAGDKVFYHRADGLLYDSLWRDGMPTEDVRAWSERYFALLGEVPGIGRYLSLARDLVVVVGEKAYRITGYGERR